MLESIYRAYIDSLSVHEFPKPVSDYSPVKLLGNGNEGYVFLARSTKRGDLVVIKFFWQGRDDEYELDNGTMRSNLKDLARISKRFRTPRILEINDSQNYVVFEYIRGLPFQFLHSVVPLLKNTEKSHLISIVQRIEDQVANSPLRVPGILGANGIFAVDALELVVIDPR